MEQLIEKTILPIIIQFLSYSLSRLKMELCVMLVFRDCEEPKTFRVAAKDSNWQNAMHEEFDALKAQGTWTLEPLPSNRYVIGSKWVYN